MLATHEKTACPTPYLFDKYRCTEPEVRMVHMAACIVAVSLHRPYTFIEDAWETTRCDECRQTAVRCELTDYDGRLLCDTCSPQCEVCDQPRLPGHETCETHMEAA